MVSKPNLAAHASRVTRADLVTACRERGTLHEDQSAVVLRANLINMGAVFDQENLARLHLTASSFAGAHFQQCNFEGAVVCESSFADATFVNCTFAKTDAGVGASFVGARFESCVFRGVRGDWHFADVQFVDCAFEAMEDCSFSFVDDVYLDACGASSVAALEEFKGEHQHAFVRSEADQPFVPWVI